MPGCVVAEQPHRALPDLDRVPEIGQKCHDQASAKMARIIRNGVQLRHKSGKDRYGRTLAYVRLRDGRDAGTVMLRAGLAIARYDSIDGYPWHPKQKLYRRIDSRNGAIRCGSPGGSKSPAAAYYANCDAVRKGWEGTHPARPARLRSSPGPRRRWSCLRVRRKGGKVIERWCISGGVRGSGPSAWE